MSGRLVHCMHLHVNWSRTGPFSNTGSPLNFSMFNFINFQWNIFQGSNVLVAEVQLWYIRIQSVFFREWPVHTTPHHLPSGHLAQELIILRIELITCDC